MMFVEYYGIRAVLEFFSRAKYGDFGDTAMSFSDGDCVD